MWVLNFRAEFLYLRVEVSSSLDSSLDGTGVVISIQKYVCTCHFRHATFSRLRSLDISFQMCIYIVQGILLSFCLYSSLIFQFMLQRMDVLSLNGILQQGISWFQRNSLLRILNYILLHKLIQIHSVSISEKLCHTVRRFILWLLFVIRKNVHLKISDAKRILRLS